MDAASRLLGGKLFAQINRAVRSLAEFILIVPAIAPGSLHCFGSAQQTVLSILGQETSSIPPGGPSPRSTKATLMATQKRSATSTGSRSLRACWNTGKGRAEAIWAEWQGASDEHTLRFLRFCGEGCYKNNSHANAKQERSTIRPRV